MNLAKKNGLKIQNAGKSKIGQSLMLHCHVCGYTEEKKEFINEVFTIDSKHVLVEHIPAMVCLRCGEETISRETTEHIRCMLHGQAKPKESISMDVFSYT